MTRRACPLIGTGAILGARARYLVVSDSARLVPATGSPCACTTFFTCACQTVALG